MFREAEAGMACVHCCRAVMCRLCWQKVASADLRSGLGCSMPTGLFGSCGAGRKLPSGEVWCKVREATFCVAQFSLGGLIADERSRDHKSSRPKRLHTAHDSSACGKAFPMLAIDDGFGYAFGPK